MELMSPESYEWIRGIRRGGVTSMLMDCHAEVMGDCVGRLKASDGPMRSEKALAWQVLGF